MRLCLRFWPDYQRFNVDSTRWHKKCDQKIRQNHVMKFWQIKPLFSSFPPESVVTEAPQTLANWKMDQRDEWIGLRIFSPESNTWKSTEALNQGDRSRRFADPNGNCKKTFELHLWKDVPRLVQQYQGNCERGIMGDCFLVVTSFGTSRWTDKSRN